MLVPDEEKEAGCTKWYVCPVCEDRHKTEHRAEECCPRTVECYYECNRCEAEHDTASEAEACCGNTTPGASIQPKQCPVCLLKADTYAIAADCCLHVHPSLTAYGRQRIAAAVASGTPWDQALAANINH